jgi:glyoxylase-like metal-dependent hydrolase (beta-lactamase superfamily II)
VKIRIFLPYVCVLVLSPLAVYAQDPRARVGEIATIRGDLYQARDRDQVTVFLVTPEGVILVDPLNPEFARWLKAELEVRFPGRPVRYVLHSSHHYERAGGAAIYDAADIVAHDNFQAARTRASNSFPLSLTPFDRNRNAVLERSESVALGADILSRDLNQNGEVSSAEVWSVVSSPKRTYRGPDVIELGGRRVELIHPGDGLGSDATVFLFPDERVLFAPGVPIHEVPPSFAQSSPVSFVQALQELERLEFDTLVSGRGETSTVAALPVVREYVSTLLDGVKAGFKNGNTIEDIQGTLVLDGFNGLRNFDLQRARHIAEAYGHLRLVSLDLSGAAEFAYLQRGVPPCASGASPSSGALCNGPGGRTFGAVGGLTVMVARAGGSLEISRTGFVTADDWGSGSNIALLQYRETVTAFLFRYEAIPSGGIGMVVTAGTARIAAVHHVEFRPSPFGSGSLEIETSALGPVFGTDLATKIGRLKFVIPVRVIRAPRHLDPGFGLGGPKWNLHVGVGVSVPLVRAVLQ